VVFFGDNVPQETVTLSPDTGARDSSKRGGGGRRLLRGALAESVP
jgi:hypothetical protein